MNNKNIYQRIDTVNDEVKKLENLIFSIQTTDIHTYPQNYEKLSMDAALRAERIACKLRNLVYTTDQPAKAAYMEQAAEAHQIHLTEENRILSISLPGLCSYSIFCASDVKWFTTRICQNGDIDDIDNHNNDFGSCFKSLY